MNDKTKTKLETMVPAFGFAGRHRTQKRNPYLNKFICIQQNGNPILGVLNNINHAEGCAEIIPAIVGAADGTLDIVYDTPTRIDFPLPIIRPLNGTIEEYVKKYNKHHEKMEKKKK